MPTDQTIATLISDGEELLGRMDTTALVHVDEIKDWVRDVERWAASAGAVLPEHCEPLLPDAGLEESSYRVTDRLLHQLKAYAAGELRVSESPRTHGRVFVSYVREDNTIVQRLCDDLRSYGVDVWVDRADLAPGQRWKQAIRDAVRRGSFFLACFSRTYVGKERTFMNEELQLAIEEIRLRPNRTVWFIPVKLSPCEIADFEVGGSSSLQDFQWVALYPDWYRGIRSIVDVVAPLPRHLRVRLELLRSPDSRDRHGAAEALYREPDPRALLDLIRALNDPIDTTVGYWAARALGRLKDPRAVPALIRAFGSERFASNRYKIIEVLEDFRTEEALAIVAKYRKLEGDPWALARWLNEMRAAATAGAAGANDESGA